MVGIHRVTIYGFCIVSLVSVIGSMNLPDPVEKNYQDKKEAPNQNEIKKMYAIRMGKRSQDPKVMKKMYAVRMGKRSQDQKEIKKMYAVRMGKRSQNQKDMKQFMVRMGKRSQDQDKLKTQNNFWSRI